jgi:hypothetical protein
MRESLREAMGKSQKKGKTMAEASVAGWIETKEENEAAETGSCSPGLFSASEDSGSESDSGEEEAEAVEAAARGARHPAKAPLSKGLERVLKKAKAEQAAARSREPPPPSASVVQRRRKEQTELLEQWKRETEAQRELTVSRPLEEGCPEGATETRAKPMGFYPSLKTVLERRVAEARRSGGLPEDRKVLMRQAMRLRLHRTIPELSGPDVPKEVRESSGVDRAQALYTRPTALCCFWCSEQTEGPPVPLALAFRERKAQLPIRRFSDHPGHSASERAAETSQYKRERARGAGVPSRWWFNVTGVFCTPGCALAAARARGTDVVTRLMFKRVYGIKRDRLRPAPPKEMLRKFGGPMTTEQFRATSAVGRVESQLVRPPLIPFTFTLHEIESVKTSFAQTLDEDAIARLLEENRLGSDQFKPGGFGGSRRGSGVSNAFFKAHSKRRARRTSAEEPPRKKSRAGGARGGRSGSRHTPLPPKPPPSPTSAPSLSSILAKSKAALENETKQIEGLLGRRKKPANNLMRFMKKRDGAHETKQPGLG